METSALDGENIKEAYYQTVSEIRYRRPTTSSNSKGANETSDVRSGSKIVLAAEEPNDKKVVKPDGGKCC